jgi:hypothetical protein
VRDAVKRFGITYPVIIDSDHGTWNAYENNYWPRFYLIDTQGYIRYDHIGEGDYDQIEKLIQSTPILTLQSGMILSGSYSTF